MSELPKFKVLVEFEGQATSYDLADIAKGVENLLLGKYLGSRSHPFYIDKPVKVSRLDVQRIEEESS